MKFIIVVIGVLLLRRLGTLSQLQRDGWYGKWANLLEKQSWFGSKLTLRLLVTLLVPLLLLIGALLLLDDVWFGVPVFVLSFLVFLYSLGRGDLEEEIDGYRDDLKRGDLQAAYHEASEFNTTKKESGSEDWSQLHDEVIGALSYRYFERYFAVIFWFVLAGAPGALLYRLLAIHSGMGRVADNAPDTAQQSQEIESEKNRVQHGLHIMEWLPARLMGLSLAFVGNFTGCLESLRTTLLSSSVSTTSAISQYVQAALASGAAKSINPLSSSEAEAEIAEIRALFSRALMLILCLVAFFVILF